MAADSDRVKMKMTQIHFVERKIQSMIEHFEDLVADECSFSGEQYAKLNALIAHGKEGDFINFANKFYVQNDYKKIQKIQAFFKIPMNLQHLKNLFKDYPENPNEKESRLLEIALYYALYHENVDAIEHLASLPLYQCDMPHEYDESVQLGKSINALYQGQLINDFIDNVIDDFFMHERQKDLLISHDKKVKDLKKHIEQYKNKAREVRRELSVNTCKQFVRDAICDFFVRQCKDYHFKLEYSHDQEFIAITKTYAKAMKEEMEKIGDFRTKATDLYGLFADKKSLLKLLKDVEDNLTEELSIEEKDLLKELTEYENTFSFSGRTWPIPTIDFKQTKKTAEFKKGSRLDKILLQSFKQAGFKTDKIHRFLGPVGHDKAKKIIQKYGTF